MEIERIGIENSGWKDTYHFLMTVPVIALLGLLAALYLVANAGFALAYLAAGGGIQNARAGSFEDAFFFSVQTMATIGYGGLAPVGLSANVIVTLESIYGMLSMALSTGILFARISRPTARVMFSRHAVVRTVGGIPTLMVRLANQRRTQIVDAQISVTLLRDERMSEGELMRRLYDLPLVRSRNPIFALSFTAMHPIDATSPLLGLTRESLIQDEAMLICTVAGIDEIFAQTVHARHFYAASEIRWDHRFADLLTVHAAGRRVIDYSRFHEVEALPDLPGVELTPTPSHEP